jgi:hypothetical protein
MREIGGQIAGDAALGLVVKVGGGEVILGEAPNRASVLVMLSHRLEPDSKLGYRIPPGRVRPSKKFEEGPAITSSGWAETGTKLVPAAESQA